MSTPMDLQHMLRDLIEGGRLQKQNKLEHKHTPNEFHFIEMYGAAQLQLHLSAFSLFSVNPPLLPSLSSPSLRLISFFLSQVTTAISQSLHSKMHWIDTHTETSVHILKETCVQVIIFKKTKNKSKVKKKFSKGS